MFNVGWKIIFAVIWSKLANISETTQGPLHSEYNDIFICNAQLVVYCALHALQKHDKKTLIDIRQANLNTMRFHW